MRESKVKKATPPTVSHLSPALVQLPAALHVHHGAVGVGQVAPGSHRHGPGCRSNVVCQGAVLVHAATRVFSGDDGTSPRRKLAVDDHLHASLVGCQVSLGLHHDAVALVGAVALSHVLVEEQAAVGDPGQDDTHGEEEEGDQSLPHLEQTWGIEDGNVFERN